MPTKTSTQLQRRLKQRHITLMSLGSAIGVGLFYGSGKAISLAGPSILLAYALTGGIIFFVMRALGELAIHNPVAGSFSRYARNYIGPYWGYLTGWNYWLIWLSACMVEITAAAKYMSYWYPGVPQWLWALGTVILMCGMNFVNVRIYGELEFWFALIKILTIIFMIVSGGLIIFFGIGNGGIATGIHNLWTHGFWGGGAQGFMYSFQIIVFAYLGVEMLGLASGETEYPEKTIPRAINNVFWRVLLFYIGTLFVIMSIYPWTDLVGQGGDLSSSPFVITFDKLGIRSAANIINFVLITAALSTCNTGIFATGRMLFNLAEQHEAPALFKRISSNGIPKLAIWLTMIILLVVVALNYVMPEHVFITLSSISTCGTILTWGIILITHIAYRRSLSAQATRCLPFPMPCYPLTSYIALLFLVFAGIIVIYSPETRPAFYVGVIAYAILTLCYYLANLHKRTHGDNLPEAEVEFPLPLGK